MELREKKKGEKSSVGKGRSPDKCGMSVKVTFLGWRASITDRLEEERRGDLAVKDGLTD